MSLFSLIILAIGLCMDSFAVSLSSGVLMRSFTWQRIGKFSLFMALFQGAMPVIGWLLGLGFRNYIDTYDHWIALGLLVFLGGRMIYEGLQHKEECSFDPCATRTVICLALATSIDALAVGISLSFLRVDMLLSATVIALTTLLFSVGGLFIGHYIGSRLQKYAEIVGGVILIAIGIKICVEHIFFA